MLMTVRQSIFFSWIVIFVISRELLNWTKIHQDWVVQNVGYCYPLVKSSYPMYKFNHRLIFVAQILSTGSKCLIRWIKLTPQIWRDKYLTIG